MSAKNINRKKKTHSVLVIQLASRFQGVFIDPSSRPDTRGATHTVFIFFYLLFYNTFIWLFCDDMNFLCGLCSYAMVVSFSLFSKKHKQEIRFLNVMPFEWSWIGFLCTKGFCLSVPAGVTKFLRNSEEKGNERSFSMWCSRAHTPSVFLPFSLLLRRKKW
jgi:hypothetical protein